VKQVNTNVSNTRRPANSAVPSERFFPLRFLIITIGGIAIAEIIAMIFVYFYRHLPYYQQVLLDATVMVVIITPLLYLLSFQPLLNHIGKRQRAEQALRQVNRALSVLNECNQALVYAEEEAGFLQQMCEIIVHIGEYRMAWIGFAEQDQARSIHPVAQFGFENGYLDAAQITWADDERGRGPTGTAIRQRDVQVNQNFLTNPHMAPWRESALQRGYQSSIALPLQDEISTFGALTIYSALPEAFNEEELHLLKKLANDLVFGITALRVRAERNRAERLNRQLSRIVEQTEDTVVVTNCDGIIEYVNPAFERLTGYTRQETLGNTPRILKSGLHDNHFYQKLWNTILKGEVFQSEIANRKKNGELFYEVKTITPLRDTHGNITHFVATGKNITEHKRHEEDLRRAYDELELRVQERTEELRNANSELEEEIIERKRAEEALRAARDELELRVEERTRELAIANQELLKEIAEREEIERQLRIQTTAMEAAADGIVITDCQGNIQWTNPALAQISGYDRGDLMGHNTKIFNSGQHDPAFYQQMWDTILSGNVWRGETTNRRRDGSLYVEEQTITPVRDHDSEITQFIAIKQDITARKQAEREIRERDQKEKILTQTIHTMQLDIARDLHDTIGQNISFLRMKLDYLAEKKTSKKTELQLELHSMARAANESYDLMRGTLAVLQSENSTDLFRLFTRYAEQIKERSSFEIDFSSQGEPRFMSAKRMRQLFYIFREILNNIEKHANASQVSLTMTWAREALSLVIFDNGIGFDMDKVQYGSHYGLKFMRERAELLNGSMIIRSEAGSGTKIILEVPYE
jgi:PAS domain S-box-containing protein